MKEPIQIMLSPEEAVLLAAILAGMTEQLMEQYGELDQDLRAYLAKVQKLRSYLPEISAEVSKSGI